jgi:hypothetical protein
MRCCRKTRVKQIVRTIEYYYFYFCIVIDFKCVCVCVCVPRRWEKTINRSIASDSGAVPTHDILTLSASATVRGGSEPICYDIIFIKQVYI